MRLRSARLPLHFAKVEADTPRTYWAKALRRLTLLNYQLRLTSFSENHPHPGKHQARAEERPDGKCLAANCPT